MAEGKDDIMEPIVWAKGDKCLCPYSGDKELYDGIIKKICRSNIGKVTAVVQFVGYEDEDCEEVDIDLLKRKDKESLASPGRLKSNSLKSHSSGMFSPLVGNEQEERLRNKYNDDDTDNLDVKAEQLSKNLFQKKSRNHTPSCKTDQVVIGGKERKGKRPQRGYKSNLADSPESDCTSPKLRRKCQLYVTGGQALDPLKELNSSKRLSDLSSILDSDQIKQALSQAGSQSGDGSANETTNVNKNTDVDIIKNSPKLDYSQSNVSKANEECSQKRKGNTVDWDSDDSSDRNGFSENDLEKPKFNHQSEGAKVPFILSEDGESPVVQVPAPLNQYLRDYQREGIKFMYSHYKQNRGAILGDDMGLGKTVQVIGLISAILGKHGDRIDVMRQKPKFIRKLSETTSVIQDGPNRDPVLIIGPGCVLYNWLGELETWGHFVVRKFHGSDKMDCLSAVQRGKVEIVVTTYETFREHQESLNSISWTAVFVDEVHKIKGLKAQTTKALRSIDTLRRFGLTGTALQNNLLELWAILDWAQPGCLGRQIDFEMEYVESISRGQRHDANKRELALARKKKEKFAKIRKGMMLRRTKNLIADQLPRKEENVVFCKLSELQTSLYRTILSHQDMLLVLGMDDLCECQSRKPQGKCCKQYTSEGHKVKSMMFTFMHLLLKVSNHVALLIPSNIKSSWQAVNARKVCMAALKHHPEFLSQTKEASFKTLSNPKYCGKMKILQGLLKVFEKEHSKVLVFSYSTQVLDILEQYIMSTGYEYRRIDGTVSSKKRVMIVHEFNTDNNIFICLISTKAGGLGLNLTGANKVVIFDPNWNPAHDLQAQDRAYRIGQRRNVTVYRLVSAGTIEENMYLRQIYKQQLLNISVEDENARRYFYAVQGSRQKKGELFGIKNMFALRTGTSCLTADIIKRNERIESALAGFEVAKYIPPVVRLQVDEDLEDIDSGDLTTSTESEQDYFAEFFDEGREGPSDVKVENNTTATKEKSKNIIVTKDTVIIKSEPEDIETSPLPNKAKVRFQEDDSDEKVGGQVKPNESKTGKGGKVKPGDSRTGKQSVKRGSRQIKKSNSVEEDGVKFDQTLAGTFNNVTDVFENCGIVHIHENRKVVGGSRAEDHMTRCAISDVYELHKNSQDLAVQCEPLSESSEDESEEVHDTSLELQHNKVRSQVVGRTKILIGQTPKPFRMKQVEKLSQYMKANSLLDFAENVLTMSLEERILMLKDFYEQRDPVYKDIITLQSTQANATKRSKRVSKKDKIKSTRQRGQKKLSVKQERGISFMENDDISASESLTRYIDSGDDCLDTSMSSMDVGNPETPLSRKRKIVKTWSGKKNRYSNNSTHIPELPSYMESVNNGEGTGMQEDTRKASGKVHSQEQEYEHSIDSCALLSQMGKSSQIVVNEGIDSVDGANVFDNSDDNVVSIVQSEGIRKDGSSKYCKRSVKKFDRRHETSILDELFSSNNKVSPRKPPPRLDNKASPGKPPPRLGTTSRVGNCENSNVKRKHDCFKEVDEIFSDTIDTNHSTESESDVILQSNTLKNDEVDCFDDPALWKKRKFKPPDKANVVDRLIADSDSEYNELFNSGLLKRKGAKSRVDENRQERSWGNVGGSESLFS